MTELEGRAHAALQSSGIKLGVDESRCGRAHAHSRLRVAEQVHDGGKKLVIVAGIYDRLEIWNKEQWEMSTHDVQAHSSDIASSLADLGI